MRGTKKIEYRNLPTKIIGERFYIYASLTPGDIEDFDTTAPRPGDLPTGVLVGTVKIKKCNGKPGDYKWHLKLPKRLKKRLRPKKHPQPVWFNPF